MDYKEATSILKVPVGAIKAVAEIESAGSGFLSNGQPKILFEAQQSTRLSVRHWRVNG